MTEHYPELLGNSSVEHSVSFAGSNVSLLSISAQQTLGCGEMQEFLKQRYGTNVEEDGTGAGTAPPLPVSKKKKER